MVGLALSHKVATLASSFPRSYSHGHYSACVDHYYACVDHYSVACVCVFTGLCICVLEPHVSAFLLCLLLLYHVACVAPSLKLASSLLRGSHGTTAVAHQVVPL